MKGFLKKDFYMTLGYLRTTLLILLAFLLISAFNSDNVFFIYYPVLLVSMLPSSLLSYDERAKFCSYAAATPATRKSYVSAKYVLSLIFSASAILLTLLIQLIARSIRPGAEALSAASLFAALCVLGLVAPGATLPFMFKLGVEKGRIAYYVVLVVFCSAVVAVVSREPNVLETSAPIGLVFCVLSVVLFALSWFLSVRFYEKREL